MEDTASEFIKMAAATGYSRCLTALSSCGVNEEWMVVALWCVGGMKRGGVWLGEWVGG